MSEKQEDVQSVVARHEQEIAALRAKIAALEDGYGKRELQEQVNRRIAEMEAEIRLQELQEAVDQEQAEKGRKRRFFRRR